MWALYALNPNGKLSRSWRRAANAWFPISTAFTLRQALAILVFFKMPSIMFGYG
ncbi:hypothetical protein GLA29479_4632 [Lysobacter antibioticus]|uniref:Uncharacterized protein n=1 Tax=Lysobacter antibioticus TaxID=84531 RepID=A0A0S2FDD3_LYSAN|nr:hypothetical protein GLA29479_4632 [Lysobacter antibioticus]ALN81567.1 hypothetical protein LA76x_3443 [Lysobacter antibioticus]